MRYREERVCVVEGRQLGEGPRDAPGVTSHVRRACPPCGAVGGGGVEGGVGVEMMEKVG